MNDGLSRIKETTAYRRTRNLFGVALGITSVLGFASLGADIEAWQRWLGGIESWVPYALAYLLLLLISLALLIPDISAWRTGRSTASSPERAERGNEDRAAGEKAEVSMPDPAPTHQPGKGQRLSDLLQAHLDEGVLLRKNIPPIPGMVNLTRPQTTPEDVEIWIRRTGRLLDAEPELKSEFNYRPGKAVLEGWCHRTRSSLGIKNPWISGSQTSAGSFPIYAIRTAKTSRSAQIKGCPPSSPSSRPRRQRLRQCPAPHQGHV